MTGKRSRAELARTFVAGDSDEWMSPPEIVECVECIAEGAIALDPFWSPAAITRPIIGIPERLDGFAQDWRALAIAASTTYVGGRKAKRALVYDNGPYSQMTRIADKVTDEAVRGVEIITLCKWDSATAWWQLLVWRTAAAVCAPDHRLPFFRPDGTGEVAMFASALIYHGPRIDTFTAHASKLGKVIRVR